MALRHGVRVPQVVLRRGSLLLLELTSFLKQLPSRSLQSPENLQPFNRPCFLHPNRQKKAAKPEENSFLSFSRDRLDSRGWAPEAFPSWNAPRFAPSTVCCLQRACRGGLVARLVARASCRWSSEGPQLSPQLSVDGASWVFDR